MTVVADTSPLNYLVLVGQIEVLRALYREVTIPPAVLRELRASSTPAATLEWAIAPPAWLKVRAPKTLAAVSPELDEGEREAIALARQFDADTILIDEMAGRREAMRHGIEVVGTLGVLLAAAQRELVDFERSVDDLSRTSFHMSQGLKEAVLDQWRGRTR